MNLAGGLGFAGDVFLGLRGGKEGAHAYIPTHMNGHACIPTHARTLTHTHLHMHT